MKSKNKSGIIEAVNIIKMVVIVAVIITVAVILLKPMMRQGSSSICQLSVILRSRWEKTEFMTARVSEISGAHWPIIGCSVSKRESWGLNETVEVLAKETGRCWQTYGKGELDALAQPNENPARCSSIRADLKGNLTPKNITQGFRNIVFKEEIDCRLGEHCCPDDYECYREEPKYCIQETNKAYKCISAGKGDSLCPPDYKLKEARIEEAYAIFSDESCEGIECYYNASEKECLEKSNQEPCGIEPSLSSDYLYDNKFQFCNATKDISPKNIFPRGCTLKTGANESCKKNVTLYEYLKPGKRTLYSFSWVNKSGERTTKMVGIDKKSVNNTVPKISGEAKILVEYLDTFTETPKPPEVRDLPGECAAKSFIDSAKGCKEYCIKAGISPFLGALFAKSIVTSPKRLGGAAVLGTVAGAGMTGSTWKAGEFWMKTGLTVSGLPQCYKCIKNKYFNMTGAEMFPLHDKILICVYEK